jgi:hypothetical protein
MYDENITAVKVTVAILAEIAVADGMGDIAPHFCVKGLLE